MSSTKSRRSSRSQSYAMTPNLVDSELSKELSELYAGFESKVADSIHRQMINVESLDEEMLSLENNFAMMKERIERSMKLQHNLCIPIGRLTDEIITEILQYGIDEVYEEASLADLALFPTYSICTRWRNVAISSPSLWSRISLPCHPNLFRLIRDRSRSNLLQVSVVNASDPDPLDTVTLGESLRQLAPRISQLRISWAWFETQPNMPFLDVFFSDHVGQKEFSALREIDLTDTFNEDPTRKPVVLNTPALRIMGFEGLPSTIPRPIPSLIELEFRGSQLEINEILDLLSYYTQLEICSIINTESCGDLEDDHDIVSLDRLQSFEIDMMHVSEMEILLAHLTLPASARLTLGTYLPDPDYHLFHRFLGPYLLKADELKITSDEKNIIYSMTYKSRGPITITHRTHDGPPPGIALLPTLASHSSDLSLIDIEYSVLPSLSNLILAFSLWDDIENIRVSTQELEFERLLNALEETPNIVCPLLKILDCAETEFSSLRMKNFLEFRENKGARIQTLKFTRGYAHSGVDELISTTTTTIVQLDPVEVEDSAESSRSGTPVSLRSDSNAP
ncbi:hypothetical protein SISNIDRAFT_496384 [Sistotremastrum niveocremeum HHB9708]|uniref:F-box domain-containing protein n=1 Tax=Sistotremastrum niveocremeum HHB9708 TaxID=1314777 RepID=A0A164SS03_9AGAM|nr:hypothetical protein SISNIDRAFT_496384 [Sistotremastrum niveocremeum HHB9708]